MVGSKEITPKFHLFDTLNPEEIHSLLGIDVNGNKYQVSIVSLLKDIKDLKNTVKALQEELELIKSIKGNKERINIFGNKAIEKNGVVGDIYTDGTKVRIKLKEKWEDL